MEENMEILENLNDTANFSNEEVDCEFQEPVFIGERFWMVAVFGTLVAVINIFENSFLSFMLFKKKSYRSSHMLYLALLAFFDVWIAAAYIPLMSLNLSVDYYQSVTLLRAWFAYMLPMITISHIAMTASSFLMVAASVERYCVSVQASKTRWMQRNRAAIACFSVILGIACKFSQLYEMQIDKNELCAGTMREYQLSLSELTQDYWYGQWRFVYRTVLTILFPFFLLAYTNIRLVVKLNKSDFKVLQSTKLSDAKRKSAVRNATRTLVFIVFTYLLANILNVVIIFWEYIDFASLTGPLETFYTFSVDIVSLSTIFAGALRLPIYVICQSNLRREFYAQFKKIISFGMLKKYKPAVETDDNENDEDRRTPEPTSLSSRQYPMLLSLGTVLLVESETDAKTEIPSCKVIRHTEKETCEKVQNI
ncbi:unnamed protein product [Caenorhabditis angaria]|uniref:G-protein coupled receptors family 1 profile domain-containing protein n=1 Tax=Caenorhabditis angaria TaxID=860376 RepID=A0A9P1IX30_9PELO|nr:unnamed protein product [Caenorhabditis angaria]